MSLNIKGAFHIPLALGGLDVCKYSRTKGPSTSGKGKTMYKT